MRDAHIGERGLARIRPASDADANSIAELHGRSFLATYPDLSLTVQETIRSGDERAAFWTSRLRDLRAECEVFVAEDATGLRGFVYTGPTTDPDDLADRTGQVYSIHVDPASQGAGIGSDLLYAAVAFLRAAGFEDVTLWVVEGNVRARGFYEARGLGLDGARRSEILALGTAPGDRVEVVRYRRKLSAGVSQ